MTALACFLLALLAGDRLTGWAAPALLRGERLAIALSATPALLAGIGTVTSLAIGVSPAALMIATFVLVGSAALVPQTSPPSADSPPTRQQRRVAMVGGIGLFWLLAEAFRRTLQTRPSGALFTGTANNLGDLPFHLGLTNLFAFGDNLPPTTPQLAGVDLAYPFFPDLLSALLQRAGLPLGPALWLPSLTAVLGLCLAIRHLARRATRSWNAALIAPLLPLFAGGVEWAALPALLQRTGTLGAAVEAIYPAFESWGIVWKNPLVALLLPQRATAFGLPLVAATVLLLWMADTSRLCLPTAGILAGLLPLVFPHGLVALAICLPALLAATADRSLRRWAAFALPAVLIAAPQLAWLRHALAGRASGIAWQPGWMAGEVGLAGFAYTLPFWLLNLGPLLPLAAIAVLFSKRTGLGRPLFWGGLWGVWLLAVLVRLAPWSWDNTKVLIVFVTLTAVPVAGLLAHLWQRRGWARLGSVVLLVAQCASGLLVVGWSLFAEPAWEEYAPTAVRAAAKIRRLTPPGAVLLEAPHHAPLAYLAGRRLVVGYPGHLWSHGLDGGDVVADVESFYLALAHPLTATEWLSLNRQLRRYGATHVVVGPHEKERYGASATELRVHLRPLLESDGIHLFALHDPTS